MRSLVRRFYPYGSERRVLRGPARGMRFIVEPAFGFTYALATDAACPRFLVGKVRPGMTVYDLGANKGQMTLLFAALVGPSGTVVSFEPSSAEFASLERNIALNGLRQVRPINAAAAARPGRMAFYYDAATPTQGKLRDVETTYRRPGAGLVDVEVVTLDDLREAGYPKPDLLKIDVEGAAAAVFHGAAGLLEEVGPDIYIELHGPEETAGVRDELLRRGYIAQTLCGRRIDDPVKEGGNPLWCHRPDIA